MRTMLARHRLLVLLAVLVGAPAALAATGPVTDLFTDDRAQPRATIDPACGTATSESRIAGQSVKASGPATAQTSQELAAEIGATPCVPITSCADGLDNDNDGLVDANDPACQNDRGEYVAATDTEVDQVTSCVRDLHLINVVRRATKVRLTGYAPPELYAGKRITIRSTWNDQIVARPTVSRTGGFAATVDAPRRSRWRSNSTRYQAMGRWSTTRPRYQSSAATDGEEFSLRLKLQRRLVTHQVTRSGRTLTIRGQIERPLARRMQYRKITARMRIDCGGRWLPAKATVRLRPSGRYAATLRLPVTRAGKVTVRLLTHVQAHKHRRVKTVRTFTLPRTVNAPVAQRR